jgi:NAD(P)H-nitrite reductase large subunit
MKKILQLAITILCIAQLSCAQRQQSETIAEKDNLDEIICYCSNISRATILEAIDNGARSLQDIRTMTTACTKGRCQEFHPEKRCCAPDILKILQDNVKKTED